MKNLLSLLALVSLAQLASAQYQPRVDDHFWRRRVTSRIDLGEKINQPLVEKQKPSYVKGADPRFGTRTRGMVEALVDAWRLGRFTGYNADSLHRTLLFSDFLAKLQKQNGGTPTDAGTTTTEEPSDDVFDDPDTDDGGFDTGSDDLGGEDAATGDAVSTIESTLDLGTLESVVEIIEERIFDKGRGAMVYDIDYITFVWVDPNGVLPDLNMVAFRYDDVIAVLDETQWKNKFNDAEDRSIREIFDQRIFNSFVVSSSQNKPNTLLEADKRRQQMIEFEHHLWSY
jgi:hypothetical protein